MPNGVVVPRLLQDFKFAGLHLMHGADLHAMPYQVDAMVGRLLSEVRPARPDFVILNGDLTAAYRGEARQAEATEIVNAVAKYANVIFVPGNHDLRGAGEAAWDRFGPFRKNVYAPINPPWKPIIIPVSQGCIVAGSIFYDLKNFIDPSIFGLDERAVKRFYREKTADGKYLLGGSTDLFPKLHKRLARAVTPKTKLLITHVPPHPFLTTIRMRSDQLTPAMQKLKKAGMTFIDDFAQDQAFTKAEHVSLGRNHSDWNKKSCINGSNVLQHYGANPPQGMTAIHGHIHETHDRYLPIAGRTIRFRSYYSPFSPNTPG